MKSKLANTVMIAIIVFLTALYVVAANQYISINANLKISHTHESMMNTTLSYQERQELEASIKITPVQTSKLVAALAR